MNKLVCGIGINDVNLISKTHKKLYDNTDAHFHYLEIKISVIDSYLNEDYNDRIKLGLTNWKNLLQEHLNNRVEFVP